MILVNEMLDKLPNDVWTNKNLKWLDQATGMGNFSNSSIFRLIDGLKDEIKDVKERKKHTVNQKKGVQKCANNIILIDKFNLNIFIFLIIY